MKIAFVFRYFLKKMLQNHIEAFGEHALGKPQCFEWFKNGDFDMRNYERGKQQTAGLFG